MHRQDDAESDQQRGEAPEQPVCIAQRIGRERVQVDHAEKKLAIEHAELWIDHVPPHACIRSAIWREMVAVSCSTASCEKIASSVGAAIIFRRCSMESSATTFPR